MRSVLLSACADDEPDTGDLHQQAARAVAGLPLPIPEGADRLIGKLTRIDRPEVWTALVEGCAALLRRAPRIDRLHQLCSWALARDPRVRRLAAAVLADDAVQIGANSILDHLAGDGDERVRREVAATARAAARARPVPNLQLLRRLAGDPSPLVRDQADGAGS
jgi:hypothetical protein